MDELKNLEETLLSEAQENGTEVRIVMTNGYQAKVTILDFDCDVILAKAGEKRWMIYRHAVSTVKLD